ncbi:MAG: response regulator, partial [Spirochaetes bacterium]|nr:response regulator [Spirochaetota bacterium]
MINNAQYKILVVDDNKTILQMISKCLCEEGYAVNTQIDPGNALEQLNENRPDLILSDIEMPEMDGYQFYEEIQNR